MKLNQKGVTLVELLAGLLLVGIVVAIAWTALSIGLKHGAVETNKTQLQQDSNLIITKLTNEHRRSDYYYLRFVNSRLEIKTCSETEGCGTFLPLTDKRYDYSGSIGGTNFTDWDETIKIEPEKSHVDIDLTVAEPGNPKNAVEISTSLTRILTSKN